MGKKTIFKWKTIVNKRWKFKKSKYYDRERKKEKCKEMKRLRMKMYKMEQKWKKKTLKDNHKREKWKKYKKRVNDGNFWRGKKKIAKNKKVMKKSIKTRINRKINHLRIEISSSMKLFWATSFKIIIPLQIYIIIIIIIIIIMPFLHRHMGRATLGGGVKRVNLPKFLQM